MSIFDFMTDGMDQAMSVMAQQIQKAETMDANLRNVTAPLENGGWIGQGAEAFFNDKNQFLQHLRETREMMQYCNNAFGQMLQMVEEAMQSINTITNG